MCTKKGLIENVISFFRNTKNCKLQLYILFIIYIIIIIFLEKKDNNETKSVVLS